MPITLKHINHTDSSSIKLAKVNYNFDQLVANGGGPMGPQGAIGQSGPQGTTGQMGFQGPIGDQGFQGPDGPATGNFWNKIDASTIDVETLNPVSNALDQFAPVVNIGYIEQDPEYGPLAKLPLVGGKTPFQWRINRRSNASTNLTFLNADPAISGNAYNFRLESISNAHHMSMGFDTYLDSYSSYKAGITSFKGSSTSTESFTINDTAATFYKDTVFNSPVVIERNLIIQDPTAATDKIAISSDNTGWVKFKSVQELGGTVPFGTIVSILPSIYADNTKFINSETINQGDTSPINITAGKGIGNYEGWYLCNGQQWTDGVMTGPSLVDYNVPMLGNFNYNIQDNNLSLDPFSQGSAASTNLYTHITGGSDIGMDVNLVSGLSYTVTSTVSTSTVQVGPNNGTTYKLKQLPQIIYLGRNDLYWQQPGTNQNPPIPLTILLDDANPSAPKLLIDPLQLAYIDTQPAGATYSIPSISVSAPSGYYWNALPIITGLPSYLGVAGITLGSGTYPTTININFNVIGPLGHPSTATTLTLGINTTGLFTAATAQILLQRSNPSNATVNLGTSYTISYNFTTGYSFTLIVTADSGYAFNGLTPTTVTSLTGGGTYTVIGSTLSSGINGANTVLTLNITITGVPVGTTSLLYALNLPIFSSVPRIYNNPGFPYEIVGTAMSNVAGVSTGNNGLYTSIAVSVINNTGAPVYIWAGINNFSTGGSHPNVSVACGYQSFFSPVFNLEIPVGPINTLSYSTTYYILPNGASVNGAQYRVATSDGYHYIRLYWSSSPGGTKQQINP